MAANLNRSIRVHLGDEWRSYARMIPVGFTPLGTVTRKTLVQAFARDQNGEYWAFGTGTPELLPQAKMQRSIAAILTKLDPI
jgi:hypothetical protein